MSDPQNSTGMISKVVRLFLRSRLSILLILLSLFLGIAALVAMPKEEDPQIIVPMADVMVSAPGVSAKEINKLVATPLGAFLQQIKGVEDVYATSSDGHAVVTVKFYVGTNQEQALVRLHNQMQTHKDQVPSLVKNWVIKPVTINDVPIVTAVLYSNQYNDFQLHRIGQEVLARVNKLPQLSKTTLVAGRALQVRIVFNPSRMAGFDLTPAQLYQAVKASDVSVSAGKFDENNRELSVHTPSFLKTPQALEQLVVAQYQGKPVYLRDVARVKEGPAETKSYSFIGFSTHFRPRHFSKNKRALYPAVTLAFAKKGGSNAVSVAQAILTKLNVLKKTVIPKGVFIRITRNYGQSAHNKVNDLLKSLTLAVLTVIIVLILF